MWSKFLKNTFKGVHFGSCLAVGLDLYSRTNSCATDFSCFIAVAEQLIFTTPLVIDSPYVVFGKRSSSDHI